MDGVRVVEVAQFTYVPASGAVLADWGADVIKVEHAETGDAQRGFAYLGDVAAGGSFAPLMEHPNRGKRSVGLALEKSEALEVLYDIVRDSDVFVTNFLPDARTRVEDRRRAPPGHQPMPGPAYGDSIGGQTIAGGIAAVLYGREKTGEPSIVDVSLLSAGAWANALAIDLSLISGKPWTHIPIQGSGSAVRNPLVGTFRTSDGRFINLTMMQPGRFWADFCKHIDREDLLHDDRFDSVSKLMDNAAEAGAIVAAEISARTYEFWLRRFATLAGQWAPVRNSVEVGHDVQLRADGYIAPVVDVDGTTRELVTSPVQFDEVPARHPDQSAAVRRAHRRHPAPVRPRRADDPESQDRRRGHLSAEPAYQRQPSASTCRCWPTVSSWVTRCPG